MLISTFLREQDRRYRRQHRRNSFRSNLPLIGGLLLILIMIGCSTYLMLTPELEPFDYSRCDAVLASNDPTLFDPNQQSVVRTPNGEWCVEYTLEGYLNTLGYEQ